MEAEKLLPCPHCGAPGELISHTAGPKRLWQASCSSFECPASFDYASPEETIAAWNTRPSGWVSVEDRMPEEDDESATGEVLVWKRWGGVWRMDVDSWMDDGWWLNADDDEDVTHWMRLPDAPPAGTPEDGDG